MKLERVPQQAALSGLRALHSVCTGFRRHELTELQSQLLLGIQKHILGSDFPLDLLTNISPEELASSVPEAELRERIIRACVIGACIDGAVDSAALEYVEDYAKALQIDLAPVNAAWKLAKHNLVLARLAIIRKSLAGVMVGRTIREEGVLAMIKQLFPLIGIELPEVTAKYRKLESYPAGTLGKEFTQYLRRNGFAFPGEKSAGPEIIVQHDCLHVLGDYGTSPSEEIDVAAFQAGCHFQDPIYGLLFGLAQYHLNIQMAPVAPSQALNADPERMIAAFARGCAVKRDMWVDFDPWKHFHRDVEELRRELGILPKQGA